MSELGSAQNHFNFRPYELTVGTVRIALIDIIRTSTGSPSASPATPLYLHHTGACISTVLSDHVGLVLG